MNHRERHPAANAPGATVRRVHEAAAWIARNTVRITWDGAPHLHGVARTIRHCRPLLRPAHLSPYGRAVPSASPTT